ncbi:BolA-like protein 3 [Pichia californica]|uniref:BolA-like protein 3 n=1 Tax=Pichia californica TaxID=460514 RepID=A0A9P7BHW2_9ASCO|nr:BolA-like protein 3 [[Candida] californica]KAG0691070.1 BolA-like protein 3 [[Candida] californica]
MMISATRRILLSSSSSSPSLSNLSKSSFILKRFYVAPTYLNPAEKHIYEKLETELEPVILDVQDVSGGCGSMYAINIICEKFNGISMIKQHRLVNSILKDEIAGWHGLQLKTKAANKA